MPSPALLTTEFTRSDRNVLKALWKLNAERRKTKHEKQTFSPNLSDFKFDCKKESRENKEKRKLNPHFSDYSVNFFIPLKLHSHGAPLYFKHSEDYRTV